MRAFVASVVLVLLGASPALATDIPAGELDANPDRYDGRELTVTGEVVGDYGVRADAVWVQLNDDPYVSRPLLERARPTGTNTSIAVRMPLELFDHVTWGDPGRYGTRGPILRFTGVFHHNDTDRGGETYVEASGVWPPSGSDSCSRPSGRSPSRGPGSGRSPSSSSRGRRGRPGGSPRRSPTVRRSPTRGSRPTSG